MVEGGGGGEGRRGWGWREGLEAWWMVGGWERE